MRAPTSKLMISMLFLVSLFGRSLLAQTVDPRDKRKAGWDITEGNVRIRYRDGTEQTMPDYLFNSMMNHENELQRNFDENPNYENFQNLSDLQKIENIESALYASNMHKGLTPSLNYVNSLIESSTNQLVRFGAIQALRRVLTTEVDLGSDYINFDEKYLKLFKVAGQQNLDSQISAICEVADGSNYLVTEMISPNKEIGFFVEMGKTELRLIKLFLRNGVNGLNPQNILCTKKATSLSKNDFFLSDLISKLEAVTISNQEQQSLPIVTDAIKGPSRCDSKQVSRALFHSYGMAKKMPSDIKHLVGISEPDCFIRGILTKDRFGVIKFSMHPDFRLSKTIEYTVKNSAEGYKDLVSQVLQTQSVSVQKAAAHANSSPPSVGPGGAIYSPFAAQ